MFKNNATESNRYQESKNKMLMGEKIEEF